LGALTAQVVEAVFDEELNEHLGYDKHDPVNHTDLNGHSWWGKVKKASKSTGSWAWRNRSTIAAAAAVGACLGSGVGTCPLREEWR
jgi:hypothetical protein